MKKTQMTAVLVLVLVAMVAGGCCRGMKVVVVNKLSKPIEAKFVTQGGPNHEATTEFGEIMPGKEKKVCKLLSDDMLPSQLTFMVEAGPADTLTKIIIIPERYREKDFKALRIVIEPDEEYGKVIRFYDAKGKAIPTR